MTDDDDLRRRRLLARRRKRARQRALADDGQYVCDACGEEIVIPLDRSGGDSQEFVEDCPVCCRPNVVFVEFDSVGPPRVWAQGE
jgi:hypothetical protein